MHYKKNNSTEEAFLVSALKDANKLFSLYVVLIFRHHAES